MEMTKCEQCGIDIERKGNRPKRFCSDRCRMKTNRDKMLSEQTGLNIEVLGLTVTPEGLKAEVPNNYGLEDCECLHCQNNRAKGSKHIVNHGEYKPSHVLIDNEENRVALPGDVDYSSHGTTEYCCKCGDELPKLSKPRTRPGKCYPCVMGKVEAIA